MASTSGTKRAKRLATTASSRTKTKTAKAKTANVTGKPTKRSTSQLSESATKAQTQERATNHVKQTEKSKYAGLRRWNLWLAGTLFLQAALVLVLSKNRALPVSINYSAIDELSSKADANPVLAAASQQVFDVGLVFLVTTVLFLTAVARLLMATWYRRKCEADLGRGINKARWFEYSFCGGLMLVVVGLLVGISDLALLGAVFGMTVVMGMLGLVIETYSQERGRPAGSLFIIGKLIGVLLLLIAGLYMFGGVVYGSAFPGFVYGLFATAFLAYVGLILTLYAWLKRKGKWADYAYVEKTYIIIIFLAYSILAWQIVAGALST